MKRIKRIFNMLKYAFSMMVTIVLLYPLAGLIGGIIKALGRMLNLNALYSVADVLLHPPIVLPAKIGSVTVDLALTILILIAGIWGWTTYESTN